MLKVAGIDPERDVKIGPVPGFTVGQTASFGLLAAKALEEGKIDGFWANGMGAEVAVRSGVGTLVLDARRDGTRGGEGLHLSGAGRDSKRLIRENPDAAAGARASGQSGAAGAEGRSRAAPPRSARSSFRRPRPR